MECDICEKDTEPSVDGLCLDCETRQAGTVYCEQCKDFEADEGNGLCRGCAAFFKQEALMNQGHRDE